MYFFLSAEYLDDGDPDYKCSHCGTIMWYGEWLNKRRNAKNPTFSLCCMQGQVQLPLLKEPPTILKNLLEGDDPRSRHFQKHIGPYNMVFSFTSLGGKVQRTLKKGKGPDMFQLQGENYHLIGNLTPPEGSEAKFRQLYIVDTENEVENRAKCLRYYNVYLTGSHQDVITNIVCTYIFTALENRKFRSRKRIILGKILLML